jgi:hypothetical protein
MNSYLRNNAVRSQRLRHLLKLARSNPSWEVIVSRPDLTPKPQHVEIPMVLSVDKSKLLWLLRHAGVSLPEDRDIEVTVKVPGGGDYSGEDIDLPVINLRWKE